MEAKKAIEDHQIVLLKQEKAQLEVEKKDAVPKVMASPHTHYEQVERFLPDLFVFFAISRV